MPVETRKAWACELQARHLVSIVKSCQAVCISRTAYYYRKRLVNDSEVEQALLELTERHPRWGFVKCFDRLRTLGHPCPIEVLTEVMLKEQALSDNGQASIH